MILISIIHVLHVILHVIVLHVIVLHIIVVVIVVVWHVVLVEIVVVKVVVVVLHGRPRALSSEPERRGYSQTKYEDPYTHCIH